MKNAKKVEIGDLVRIPVYQFVPMRRGWNGWIFRVGVVEKLYRSKSGKECATVRYCSRCAGRYQLLPATETTINVLRDHCFECVPLAIYTRNYKAFREYEKTGEEVCWDEDTAFLVQNGYIAE